MSVIPHTGSQCLDLATRAVECLQSDPEVAQQHLEVIKQSTPTLLEIMKERVTELETKRDELQHQDASLSREIGAKEEAKQQLQREINNLEAKKVRDEASLEDARRQLREAESKRNDAQERKDGAVGGTVAAGVGAVVLGVLFPPTLFVTAPAVATIGTISIKEASDAVDRYRARVSGHQRDIEEEKSKIQEANKGIRGIEGGISDLTSKQATLHANRGHLRNEIVFLQKAVTYFGDLHVAVEGSDQITDSLHRIVEMANKKRQYKILDSKGSTTITNSFKETWEQVEDKVMDGDSAGYLGIVFVELPQLE